MVWTTADPRDAPGEPDPRGAGLGETHSAGVNAVEKTDFDTSRVNECPTAARSMPPPRDAKWSHVEDIRGAAGDRHPADTVDGLSSFVRKHRDHSWWGGDIEVFVPRGLYPKIVREKVSGCLAVALCDPPQP